MCNILLQCSPLPPAWAITGDNEFVHQIPTAQGSHRDGDTSASYPISSLHDMPYVPGSEHHTAFGTHCSIRYIRLVQKDHLARQSHSMMRMI